MKRVPENELMLSRKQALAYASADFSDSNQLFVKNIISQVSIPKDFKILDVGCGDGEIPIMLFRKTLCHITALDGSLEMLKQFQIKLNKNQISSIQLINSIFNKNLFLPKSFDVLISNSVLHHVSDPVDFWSNLINITKRHGKIFVMDLIRPSNEDHLQDILDRYAGDDPVLYMDFKNSLKAAYTTKEVKEHLLSFTNISYNIKTISDRHFFVTIDIEK